MGAVTGLKVFKVKQGLVVFCGLTFTFHLLHPAASVLRYSLKPRAASLQKLELYNSVRSK